MHSAQLLEQIEHHYQVGHLYATAYMNYWVHPHRGRHRGLEFGSLEEILGLPEPDSMWFDYAMSTNLRGRDLCTLALSLPQTPQRPRRFLDVGCGFGGLLAAFAERGLEVRGIELDIERVQLARANCQDHGLSDIVIHGDFLDAGLVSELGRFDIIAMIDVVEHVSDVPRALRNVVTLLNPGGLAILEIPNKQSLRFVAADGHFGLFGITMLSRTDAQAYHQAIFASPYDVGDYHYLDDYRLLFEELDCDVVQVQSPSHSAGTLDDVAARVAAIQSSFEQYRRDVAPRLSRLLDARLQVELAAYISALARDWPIARAQPESEEAFRNKYLIDFWTLVAKARTDPE